MTNRRRGCSPDGAYLAPFWAIHLISAGRWATGLVLLTGVGLAAFAFVQLMRRRHTYAAYFVTIGALALAWAVYASP